MIKQGLFIKLILLTALQLSTIDAQIFSVKAGSSFQSATVGFNTGSFRPYMGLDIVGMSFDVNSVERYMSVDLATGSFYVASDNTLNVDGSLRMFIPNFGALIYFSDHEKIRPFAVAQVFKSFASVSFEGEEVWREYDTGGTVTYELTDEYQLDGDLEQVVEEIAGFLGFNVGFGVEYFIDEHFSIGGEYLLGWVLTSGTTETDLEEDQNGDGILDYREEIENEVSGNLNISRASVSLNFHF